MGIYKVIAPTAVVDVEPGETFEHEFDSATEADLLANGRIEIVPRDYRVVGSSTVCDTKPGKTFKGTFTVGQEQALLDGGHIERVETKQPAKPGKSNDSKKEG